MSIVAISLFEYIGMKLLLLLITENGPTAQSWSKTHIVAVTLIKKKHEYN